MAFTSVKPQLVFLEQTCLCTEPFSRNGLQKQVHVVVKNAPFLARIGLCHGSHFNLKNATFDISLLYDSPDGDYGEKEVDYLKTKPVSFKSSVNPEGTELSLELRIKVLTSQHENSFFRVRISALNPTTGLPIHPSLSLQTAPYKVISKPEQNRKRKAPAIGANLKRKKTVNDVLIESMMRLEQQQLEQQSLLQKLLSQPPVTLKSKEDQDFESCFKTCFHIFRTLSSEEKPRQIRRLVRSLGPRDAESLAEFIDMFVAEGLDKDIGRSILDMKLPLPSSAANSTNAFSTMDQMLSHDSYKDFLRSSLTDLTNSLSHHLPGQDLPELCC